MTIVSGKTITKILYRFGASQLHKHHHITEIYK